MSGRPAVAYHAPDVWNVALRPGDVLFVHGTSWISRQILSATRAPGEPPAVCSHVGLVDTAGTVRTAEILEAVRKVRRTTIESAYYRHGAAEPPGIAVARCLSTTDAALERVLERSREMENRAYGWAKLPLHLLDAWYGRAVRRPTTPVLFRRLGRTRLPICSWHVALSWGVAGETFGGVGRYATPDDLHDAVLEARTRFRWGWVLGPWPAALPVP